MISRPAVPRILAVLALIVALAGAMDLLVASTAQAQDNYKSITRLGGGNRFDPPLKDRVSVQKWVAKKRTQTAIADVLGKAGLSSLNATVIDILTKASPDQLKETQVEPGTTMVWMAFRRGGGKPDIVRNVKWAGKKPFPGFTFVIDDLNQTYTFVLPHPCSNLALMSSEPSREKARLDAEKAAADKAAAEKAAAEKAAAERAAAEKAAADKAETERLAAEDDAKLDWFVSGLFGKERRTREVEPEAAAGGAALVNESLCSPLLGVKFGPELRVKDNFKINPAVGLAVNFEDSGYTSLFAEAEFNYYSSNFKNYIGASFGIWDYTHSDWVTPSIGVQVGSQVWTNAKEDKMYLVAEGRMFTRTFDAGLENNYQFWAGIRYVIR